jgi:hypothetical protein
MNNSRRVDLSFPLRLDGRGKVATATYERHIYEMIEQILFTLPGERVNRPTFGSKVPFYVFQPIRPDVFVEVRSAVELALQTWMSGVITVRSVEIAQSDSTLELLLTYTITALNQTVKESFRA